MTTTANNNEVLCVDLNEIDVTRTFDSITLRKDGTIELLLDDNCGGYQNVCYTKEQFESLVQALSAFAQKVKKL